jgi:UDP-N-acetyl-D-galactosamine dehydrogenase
VIVIAVSHQKFIELGVDKIREFGKNKHVLFDVKSIFEKEKTDGRL